MRYIYFADSYEYRIFYDSNSCLNKNVKFIYDIHLAYGSKFQHWLFGILKRERIARLFPFETRNIWNKYLVPNDLSREERCCFVFSSIYACHIWKGFFRYLKRKYFCKIVIVLSDTVDSYHGRFNLEFFNEVSDLICTYNDDDVTKYSLELNPPIVYQLSNVSWSRKDIDVLYVGKSKGREGKIIEIYKICSQLGLKCDFYLADGKLDFPGINYINWISYSEILDKVKRSKCILNILQDGADGITLRDIEAYNYGTYILSDSKSEFLVEIFNKNQVIDMNVPDYVQELSTITEWSGSFPRRDIKYTFDNFFNWIESKLNYEQIER